MYYIYTMVDINAVLGWLEEVTGQIRGKKSEVARLEKEIAADTRRESALKALLAESDGALGDAAEIPRTESTGEASEQRLAAVSVHPIEQGSIDILREHGKPLHISKLRAELIHRGVPIPGKARDANVIVYMARSPHVCRVGRGMYALRAWGVPEVPPRRKRSKRRRRTARKV